MSLNLVSYGSKSPQEINVIIEIPAQGAPIKYEVHKESGALFVDRFLGTAMHYPCNYGYIPNTLSEDGDPVDVLVVSPLPLSMGCVICCRPIGMLHMTDESGKDAKILAVPIQKLTPLYKEVHQPTDLPQSLLSQIVHFFEHYKDLEENKWVKVDQWVGASEATQEILASIARFNAVESTV